MVVGDVLGELTVLETYGEMKKGKLAILVGVSASFGRFTRCSDGDRTSCLRVCAW